MNHIKVILSLIIFTISQDNFAQNNIKIAQEHPLIIGETVEFHSNILDEKRVLNVYLPYGYSSDSLKKYPVIYLLDGSMDEDFIHISGLVQFASFPWINMLPPSIVVGIANIDRKRDFTFHTDDKKLKKEFPTTGESVLFIDFIEKELQPLIEDKYITDTVKTLIGQSLGGLLATEILFKKPELFDNYVIVSPSLWWDNESLMKFKPKPYSSDKSIYIAVGNEDEIMQREAKALYEQLKTLNKKNTRLYFKYFENQNHGDVLHLATYSAFEIIFNSEKKPSDPGNH